MHMIKKYMKMPSTWKGLFALLGVAGVVFLPEQQEAIAAAGLSALALWEVFRKEED